jgi:hypothetical protein
MLAYVALIMGNESQCAQAELSARENLGFQFPLAEENPLPYLHLAAGPNQRLPSLGSKFASEEDFDFSRQMFPLCGPRRRLRMDAGTPPEQAGRNDARIIEDDEFVTA